MSHTHSKMPVGTSCQLAPHACPTCCSTTAALTTTVVSAVTLDDGPDGLDERQWDNSWAAQGTQDHQPQDHQHGLLPTALADGVELQQHPDIPQQQPLQQQQQQQQQHNPAVLLTSGPSNGTASRLVAAAAGIAAVPSYAATTVAAESGGLPAGSAARVQTAKAEQSVLPGTNNTVLV